MKTTYLSKFVLFLIPAFLGLSACKKTGNAPGSGGNVPANSLYPATMIVYEGSISSGVPVWTYQYNQDNQLLSFGEEGKNFRQVSPGKVVFELSFSTYKSKTDYVFTKAGSQSYSIFNQQNQPGTVSIQTSILNLVNNQVTQPDIMEWNFSYNADFLVREEVSPGLARQVNYGYDDKKNLSKIEFKELEGPLALLAYTRVTVTGYDDKFSPFSAVKGYRWASYPQTYTDQYVQAFSPHNPATIKTEFWSTTKNAYYVGETTNFVYTYNDKDYPTKIVATTRYTPEAGASVTGVKTYEFTYK